MIQFSLSEINYLLSLLNTLKNGESKYKINEYMESEFFQSILSKCKIEIENFKNEKSIEKFLNEGNHIPPQ
jgi:hypothetical protein